LIRLTVLLYALWLPVAYGLPECGMRNAEFRGKVRSPTPAHWIDA